MNSEQTAKDTLIHRGRRRPEQPSEPSRTPIAITRSYHQGRISNGDNPYASRKKNRNGRPLKTTRADSISAYGPVYSTDSSESNPVRAKKFKK